jgi:uncharacterized protein YdeI (YjbR/CyaY-like superfamily)
MKKPLPEHKLLYVSNRTQWRAWLKKHYKTETEVWLVYFKKSTGKRRISYNDAVEEALCFGWIDSTVRAIDEDRFAQRFSVRLPGSKYSQANLERLRAVANQGKVAKEVLQTLPDLSAETFRVPDDILEAIKASKQAWKNFRRFSQSYVRMRVAYVEGARKRPAEFKKRLSHLVRMTEENKQFGFGGIEKLY